MVPVGKRNIIYGVSIFYRQNSEGIDDNSRGVKPNRDQSRSANRNDRNVGPGKADALQGQIVQGGRYYQASDIQPLGSLDSKVVVTVDAGQGTINILP